MEKKTFNIIRYRGQQNRAQVDGKWVERQEQLLVPEYEAFVPCAPYEEHFIFEYPYKNVKSPAYQCTCGAMAVIVGKSGYLLDSSAEGKMFVCLNHATYGVHQGGTKWI